MFLRCFNFETLKTIKEFKHVRLKSTNKSVKDKTKLPSERYKLLSECLCKILNCNIHTAREIISKNREIAESSDHIFCQNAKFCRKYLKLSDLVEFPALLTFDSSLLHHRYFSLKELGFINVTPSYIFRFPNIIKMTPQALKEKRFPVTCEYKSDILVEYLDVSKRIEINNKLYCMYKNGSDLQKIKETMNAEFLAAKFECSIGKAYQMLHKYGTLRIQSIFITNQLLNVLYECGFSTSKICSCPSLLSVHHETVKHFLSEFPDILGVNTLFLVKRLPLLLKQEDEYIQKIETILKDFNINKDQLICCPKVLSIAPSTLQKRLTALCSTEDFAVLKSNKKFLWLVYYFSNLNSRLQYLKAENMPCSINMFTTSKTVFEKNLLYNNTRICIRETYVYLAETFKMSEKVIFNRLHHCYQYRNGNQNVSTLNCRKVIEFLLLSGVTKEQIYNGLEIVYFDIDTVKMYFNRLKRHPHCQPYEEWTSHYNLIQLLIYTIEVMNYHPYEVESDEHEELYLEFSSGSSLW